MLFIIKAESFVVTEERQVFFFSLCGMLFLSVHINLSIWFLIFFFLFWPQYMEVPSQGSNPSCSCDLRRRCSNALLSLTHCTRLSIQLALPQRQARSLTHSATVGTPFWFLLTHLIFFIVENCHFLSLAMVHLGLFAFFAGTSNISFFVPFSSCVALSS